MFEGIVSLNYKSPALKSSSKIKIYNHLYFLQSFSDLLPQLSYILGNIANYFLLEKRQYFFIFNTK